LKFLYHAKTSDQCYQVGFSPVLIILLYEIAQKMLLSEQQDL